MARVLADNSAISATSATRRDFLEVATAAAAAVGAAVAVWPLVDSMNPSADVRALATVEIDLAPIELGQRVTVKWRGQPVFIFRRPPKVVELARANDSNPSLNDPATDSSRVIQPEWLIVIGVCTHLGCVPLGQGATDPRGKFGGWFCPCHGSLYDVSGRVRRGPAPRNLEVPPYQFLGDGKVLIG